MKLRKKCSLLVLLLVMAMVFLQVTPSVQAKSKSYRFTYKKVTVYMDGPAKRLIKKAGKPKSKKVTKSCAYNGKDRIYKYNDFILYTYSNTDNGPEYINGITFLTSKVSTKEGIKIGSSYSSVQEKYGDKKDYLGVYTYKKGNSKLQIQIEDDEVINIRYIKA